MRSLPHADHTSPAPSVPLSPLASSPHPKIPLALPSNTAIQYLSTRTRSVPSRRGTASCKTPAPPQPQKQQLPLASSLLSWVSPFAGAPLSVHEGGDFGLPC